MCVYVCVFRYMCVCVYVCGQMCMCRVLIFAWRAARFVPADSAVGSVMP